MDEAAKQAGSAGISAGQSDIGTRENRRRPSLHSGAATNDTSASTGKNRRRRGDEVRERVLAAALECFATFGFEGTSTREVAARADVTHTLVLYHFRSKHELWKASLEYAIDPYITEISRVFTLSKQVTASEALRTFIATFVRMSAQRPEIHRILSMEGATNSERLGWIIDSFLREHFKMVCDLIRRGQAEGEVRPYDVERLYYFIIGNGATLPTISTEYRALTSRDIASDSEILRNIAFTYEIVFR